MDNIPNIDKMKKLKNQLAKKIILLQLISAACFI